MSVTGSNDKPARQDRLAEETEECRKHGYILTGRFLGQGAYAKVYLGQPTPEKMKSNTKLRLQQHRKSKQVQVAVKIISAATAPEIYISKFLPREVATMNRCHHHPNVIQLYDIFATRQRIYLIMEYAECGDILSFVNRCFAKGKKKDSNVGRGAVCLSEDKARRLFTDIIAGVKFVHSKGVAHRDLKCENLLLGAGHRVKLSDFGFAIHQEEEFPELLRTHCGSYAYASPEILRQQTYDGRMADLWSLGVILFAIVNGVLPFKESNAKAVLGAMKKTVYFKSCLSAACKDLIRGLLRMKPQNRLTLQEISAHDWMNQLEERGDSQAVGDAALSAKSPSPPPPEQTMATLQIHGESNDERFDSPEHVREYLRSSMGRAIRVKSSSSRHRHQRQSLNNIAEPHRDRLPLAREKQPPPSTAAPADTPDRTTLPKPMTAPPASRRRPAGKSASAHLRRVDIGKEPSASRELQPADAAAASLPKVDVGDRQATASGVASRVSRSSHQNATTCGTTSAPLLRCPDSPCQPVAAGGVATVRSRRAKSRIGAAGAAMTTPHVINLSVPNRTGKPPSVREHVYGELTAVDVMHNHNRPQGNPVRLEEGEDGDDEPKESTQATRTTPAPCGKRRVGAVSVPPTVTATPKYSVADAFESGRACPPACRTHLPSHADDAERGAKKSDRCRTAPKQRRTRTTTPTAVLNTYDEMKQHRHLTMIGKTMRPPGVAPDQPAAQRSRAVTGAVQPHHAGLVSWCVRHPNEVRPSATSGEQWAWSGQRNMELRASYFRTRARFYVNRTGGGAAASQSATSRHISPNATPHRVSSTAVSHNCPEAAPPLRHAYRHPANDRASDMKILPETRCSHSSDARNGAGSSKRRHHQRSPWRVCSRT